MLMGYPLWFYKINSYAVDLWHAIYWEKWRRLLTYLKIYCRIIEQNDMYKTVWKGGFYVCKNREFTKGTRKVNLWRYVAFFSRGGQKSTGTGILHKQLSCRGSIMFWWCVKKIRIPKKTDFINSVLFRDTDFYNPKTYGVLNNYNLPKSCLLRCFL